MTTAACVLLISGLWLGADAGESEPHRRSPVVAEIAGNPVATNFKGKVVRVLAEERRLAVRIKWRGTRTFEVAKAARITRNGSPASLSRLRPGDQVRMVTKQLEDGPKVVRIYAWMRL